MRGCRYVRARLGRLLDGEMPESQAAALREHLARCPQCGGAAVSLRALEAALDRLPIPPVPPGVHERAMARVRRENLATRPFQGYAAAWRSWPLPTRLAASAALAAACALGLLAGSTAARSEGQTGDRDSAIMMMDAGTSLLAAYMGERR